MIKKCLIVVDYQNDFVSGSLGFKGAETLDEIIVDKINQYLNLNHDIIFTFDTHDENYLQIQEGKRLPIEHCIKGKEGHLLYGKSANYLNKAIKIFEKPTFGSLDLGNFLSTKKYDSIELCGLVTNMCVISNTIIAKAALPEALIVVDSKACMSFDNDLHHQTLNVLKGMQVEVI